MPTEGMFVFVFSFGGLLELLRAWWAYTRRAPTPERFGRVTWHIFHGCVFFTGAATTLIVMIGSQWDRVATGYANIAGLVLMCVSLWLEKTVVKFGERWFTRHRFKSPDFAEDEAGNSVQQSNVDE